MNINPGNNIAIVGQSGQGKSTIVQLLERFYDLNGGDIMLDGNKLKDLNVNWLREQIGLVSQEPILFNTTIYENIKFGAVTEVSMVEIEEAAKQANAHEFISQLDKG